MANPVLQLADLTVRFQLKRGQLTAVDGVTCTVHRSETFGLVGESGSGKTVTARAVMRLIPIPPGEMVHGRIRFEGHTILHYAVALEATIRFCTSLSLRAVRYAWLRGGGRVDFSCGYCI